MTSGSAESSPEMQSGCTYEVEYSLPLPGKPTWGDMYATLEGVYMWTGTAWEKIDTNWSS